MANARYRPRGDTAANWASVNPVLATREIGLELDTGRMKVGDGTTAWNSLPSFLTTTVADGDKGDVVVSSGGSTWTIDSSVISAYGRTLTSASTAALARGILGLGGYATIQIFRPEDYGAVGDGVTNDNAAFEAMNVAIAANDGGFVVLHPEGIYLVGGQTFVAGQQSIADSFPPDVPFIIHFDGCTKPCFVIGNGAKILCEGGLLYGVFNDDGTPKTLTQPYYSGGRARPYDYMIFAEGCSGGVYISDVELDGNIQNQIIGSGYDDVGIQLSNNGIVTHSNTCEVVIERVHSHHHGLDGITSFWPGVVEDDPSYPITLIDCDFLNNARQGFSWVGGKRVTAIRCRFSETGRDIGAFGSNPWDYSPPGAGLDIEAEASICRHGRFIDCEFSNNIGVGTVHVGDVADIKYIRSDLVGTTSWAIWGGTTPYLSYIDCRITGGFSNTYGHADPAKAQKFIGCDFLFGLNRSPTGVVYTGGGSNYMGECGTLEDKNVLFERCNFDDEGTGVDFPWTAGAEVIYRDCNFKQSGTGTTSFSRGSFYGVNVFDVGSNAVDANFSHNYGRLIKNGVPWPGFTHEIPHNSVIAADPGSGVNAIVDVGATSAPAYNYNTTLNLRAHGGINPASINFLHDGVVRGTIYSNHNEQTMDFVGSGAPGGGHFRFFSSGFSSLLATLTSTGNFVATGTVSGSNLSGTNTGDQTSIVGITGTLAQFNTAITDANIPQASTDLSDSASLYKAGGTDVALADGGTGTSLTDPNADRILFWDDSAGNVTWLELGTNLSITGTVLNASGGGGGVADGDKGDITVSASGATWTIDNGVVSLAKMADVATGTVFYRKTTGTGAPEVQTLATLKTDLGLTGTNTGDQTITLTGNVTGSGTGSFATTIAAGVVANSMLANAAALSVKGNATNASATPTDIAAGSDGDVLRRSGTALAFGQIATAGIADGAVTLAKQANMATASVVYRKTSGSGPPEVQTLATLKTDLGLTGTNSGDQTSIVGITGTLAQFNTAITDANIPQASTDLSDSASLYKSGGTDVALADGGTGASLTDPNADRIMFWDDSAGQVTWLSLGTNLSITGTTLDASGGGLSDGDKGDVVVGGSGTTLTVESANPSGGTFNVTGAVTATGDLTCDGITSTGSWFLLGNGSNLFIGAQSGATVSPEHFFESPGAYNILTFRSWAAGVSTIDARIVSASAALAGSEGLRLTGRGISLGIEGGTYNILAIASTGISVIGTGSFTGDVTIPGEAYGAGWNGSNEAATKNDIYDKIEGLSSVYQPLDTQLTSLAGLSYTGNANKVVAVNSGETGFELVAAGGGGSPGGSDRQIQFNNAGAFGGASALDVDTNGNLRTDYAATVTTPGADQITFVPQRLNASGGRVLPRWRSEDAITMTVANHQGRNTIAWGQAIGNATTAIAPVGMSALSAVGSATARNVASTSRLTRARRLGYVSAGTAGSAAGLHNAAGHTQYAVGGAAGSGFMAIFRWGVSDASLVSGAHCIIGMRQSSLAPTVTANPNAAINNITCCQTNGSANWQICYGGSAAQTPVDTGIAVNNTDLMEFIIYARPDVNNKVTWRLENVSTGTVASGELTGTAGTALPANTTFLGPLMWRSNNATASAVGIDIVSFYLECDIA